MVAAWRGWLVAVLIANSGCGDDATTEPPADAGGADALPPDGGPPAMPEAPAPPALTPCADGWRLAMVEGGHEVCEPWPETGIATCAAHEAHFPGEPGCTVVGSACPSGDFPADLPTDGSVVYVLAGSSGGDGSMTAPYATIAEAMATARSGTTIAVGAGTYDEVVNAATAVTIRGACAERSVLTSSMQSDRIGVVLVRRGGIALRDLSIRGGARPGVWIDGVSASVDIEGVIIDDVQFVGVYTIDQGSLSARSLVIRGTRARPADGVWGRGLNVEEYASADMERIVFERNRELGIFVGDVAGTLTLADAAIIDTEAQLASGQGGRAVNTGDEAMVSLERVVAERNREIGLSVDTGALVATDVVVRETEHDTSDGTGGRGLSASRGGRVDARRAWLHRNRDLGFFVLGDGTTATLEDAVITDMRARMREGFGGRGVNIQEGASATVRRVAVERSIETGMVVFGDGATLHVEDAIVRDTAAQTTDLKYGRAFAAELGGTLDIVRAVTERNHEVSIFSFTGAQVSVADVVVRETLPRECVTTSCADSGAGAGLAAIENASLRATRFLVEDAAQCGLMVARDGALDVSVGTIALAPIGACVQVADYDFDRLTDRVVYLTDISLDTTDLPVPDGSTPLP